MKRFLIALFFGFLFWGTSSAVMATEGQEDSFNPLVAFVVVEGALVLSAEIVSKNPNDWGIFMALIGVPWAFVEAEARSPESEAAKWIAGGLTAAIAAYYINLDEDKYSEDEIFQDNLKVMNTLLLTGIVAGYFLDDNEEKGNALGNKGKLGKVVNMGFRPLIDGAEFRMMYQF